MAKDSVKAHIKKDMKQEKKIITAAKKMQHEDREALARKGKKK